MAKRKGLIPFLTPLIKTLKKSSVRISNHLYETALRLAGE
jgi:predicted nucleic acid-binding protein